MAGNLCGADRCNGSACPRVVIGHFSDETFLARRAA
jgi:hypothetical protein